VVVLHLSENDGPEYDGAGRRGMRIEVLGMFGGNYAIFELDGEGDPVEISSDAELRGHLRTRGLTEQQISNAIADLKAEPRKITLTVKP
jgi:hypothetical protein